MKYLIGPIGHVFLEISQVKHCFEVFGLLHVLKPLLNAGATMRQLDTPGNLLLGLYMQADSKLPIMTCHSGRYTLGMTFPNLTGILHKALAIVP